MIPGSTFFSAIAQLRLIGGNQIDQSKRHQFNKCLNEVIEQYNRDMRIIDLIKFKQVDIRLFKAATMGGADKYALDLYNYHRQEKLTGEEMQILWRWLNDNRKS